MLIGVSGTLGAGKTEIARYLTFQGFKYIELKRSNDIVPGVDQLSINKVLLDHELKADVVLDTIDELLEYTTKNWLSNFVLTDISTVEELELLAKRPFFLHISVDAPLKLRWRRQQDVRPDVSFQDFIELSDSLSFDKSSLIIEIISKAALKIINISTSVEQLYVQLSELNLLDQTRLRPTWDAYFMRLADLAAMRSNCMKRRVGCVIARDNRIIATGYNGTPRHLKNCNEGGCPRCNDANESGAALSTCLCLHAEENALLESGRDRIGSSSILYCNTCPCLTCSIKIVQSGIREVVYSQSYKMDILSSNVMREANVLLRQYTPPKDGVII